MPDLDATFEKLKEILARHADRLDVAIDEAGNYTLNTPANDEKGKPVFFAMARMGKGRVAFHLMPVYCHSELLDDISDALRKRMQGKSCFNFTEVDTALFKELAALTRRGLDVFSAQGRA